MLNFTILKFVNKKNNNMEDELKEILKNSPEYSVNVVDPTQASQEEFGQVILLDSSTSQIEDVLRTFDRKGKAVIIVLHENEALPQSVFDKTFDDVLVRPFRLAEVLGKVKIYQQILMWDEVNELNESFQSALVRLHEDVKLTERLQKAKSPTRFKNVKGFKVKSRYLAGTKSGGEYFDLMDSAQGDRLSILLSDSSSYGLSSAVLSVLMRVAAKLTGPDIKSSYETVHKIYDELLLTLGEKDQLSLFYGMVSRKDLTLSYLNLGNSKLFVAPPSGDFRELPTQGDPISKQKGLSSLEDIKVPLEPNDRLVLLSDGFIEAAGGMSSTFEILNRFRKTDPAEALNEFVFKVKAKFEEEDQMPAQDCTGVILDVESNVLRIARR